MRRSVVLAACLATILAVSCGKNPAPNVATDSSVQALHTISSVDNGLYSTTVVERTGVLYTLFKPLGWEQEATRRLIVYAHGYLDPGDPRQDLTEIFKDQRLKEFVEGLLAMHYAIAWSTAADRHGYAVQEGAKQTADVRGVWNSVFSAPPTFTYVAGHSLGGLVTLDLAEHDAGRFDGALAMCAPLAGSQFQTDYIANVRVLFDTFFGSDVLADPITGQTRPDWLARLMTVLTGAAQGDPTLSTRMMGLLAATVDGKPILQVPLGAPNDKVGAALVGALRYSASGTADLLARAGGSPFDPSKFEYSIPFPFVLNTSAFPPFSPKATHYLDKYYSPTFDPKIPMITIHNLYDPDVPYVQERIYADGADGSPNLAQYVAAEEYGHCNFTPGEHLAALETLRVWVEDKVTPPDTLPVLPNQ